MEALIAVKSPIATPATVARATFCPRIKAYEITSSTVGPGISSSTVDAAAKASQCSNDMGAGPSPRPSIHVRDRGASGCRIARMNEEAFNLLRTHLLLRDGAAERIDLEDRKRVV